MAYREGSCATASCFRAGLLQIQPSVPVIVRQSASSASVDIQSRRPCPRVVGHHHAQPFRRPSSSAIAPCPWPETMSIPCRHGTICIRQVATRTLLCPFGTLRASRLGKPVRTLSTFLRFETLEAASMERRQAGRPWGRCIYRPGPPNFDLGILQHTFLTI